MRFLRFAQKARSQKWTRRGMLSLEWILLITVVVIGIVGGVGAVRNALLSELHDLAEAIQALNINANP